MLFTWFLLSVPLSCFAFITDNTEKLTSLIGELTERLADLEERLSTQEYINIDLETRLKVQERKSREQEDLIKALSARTFITSKQTDLERQQDEFLHHLRFNRKLSVDRKKNLIVNLRLQQLSERQQYPKRMWTISWKLDMAYMMQTDQSNMVKTLTAVKTSS